MARKYIRVKREPPAKTADRLVKYRVTVSGDFLRQKALFDTFNIHVRIGSTAPKIARYTLKALGIEGIEYRYRLTDDNNVRIWVSGQIGGISVERIQ